MDVSHLKLDDTERRMFQHAASGYGAVVTGGTPETREESLRNQLEGPFLAVDGRGIEDTDEFIESSRRIPRGLTSGRKPTLHSTNHAR